ncbi:MAG: response regulator [Chloroflexota bacterium]
MTILVVDDEAGIRQLLEVFLTHHGYSTASVANGAEALNYLRRSQVLPDMILLDMMMPVMGGTDFRLAQLQDPRIAAVPVVLMSAAAELPEETSPLQFAAHLPKPIDFEALRALVERYCLNAQERAGSATQ